MGLQPSFIVLMHDARDLPLPTLLLHHVCQLVGDQPPTLLGLRSIPSCAKYDVVTEGVGVGVDVTRRLLGGRI